MTPPAGEFAIERQGFLTVRLDADTLRFGYVDETGATLYRADVTRAA